MTSSWQRLPRRIFDVLLNFLIIVRVAFAHQNNISCAVRQEKAN